MKLLTHKLTAADPGTSLFGLLPENHPIPPALSPDPEVSVLHTGDGSCLELPEGICRIESEAFRAYAAGKTVVLPNSLRWIECGALCDVKQVCVRAGNPLFRMENGCLIRSGSASENCLIWAPDQPIVSDLPDSVTEIREDVFRFRSGLISLHLPRRLRVVPERAFLGCSGLRRVFLPRALEEVQYEAFSECPNLEAVIMEGTTMFRHFGISKDAFPGIRQVVVFSQPNPWMSRYLDRHMFARLPLEDAWWILRRESGPEENREEEIHRYLMERIPMEYLVPSRFLTQLYDAGVADTASLLSRPKKAMLQIFSVQELEHLEDELARKSVYLQS